jgi:hypothetical protein
MTQGGIMRAFVTSVLVAATAATYAQTPTPGQQSTSPQGATGQQQSQTVTGCLTSAQNSFTLTVTDPQQPGATTPTTVTYALTPAANVDLKAHVNHKVEVRGRETAGQTSAAVVDSSRSQATPAGTSGTANTGKPTPTVETTAKAQIVAKTLSVESVKMVAARCDDGK